MADRASFERAIAAQESLRGTVPDDVVDAAVTALRRQLTETPETPRRRQVTVLFADLIGFTGLSDALDAEHVADLTNAIWERVDAVIGDHGGRIDKHIGDAVMAVWGMDEAREDEPESALRAALAIQAAIEWFRDERAIDVSMRIGVNTGPVLVGTVGSTAELTVMGDTVNIASRLEHLAEPGTVLASHDVYRHVRGVFDVEAREPLAVRGKPEPVRAYVVRSLKPRAFRIPTRGVEGVETRTIGRSGELQRLQESYRAAVDGAGARLVAIVGDAGTGKSRLLSDFKSWLELRPEAVWFFQGRCLPSRRHVALGLLRDVLLDRFAVLESDPPETVVTRFVTGLAPTLSAAEAKIVLRWLGLVPDDATGLDADRLAEVATALLRRWFATLADEAPVIVALEDLHWADRDSPPILAEIVTRLASARLLVIGLTRPDPEWASGSWGSSRSDLTSITLDPLQPEPANDLAREILQRVEPLADSLVEFIATRSEGNPFFAEELVKMLCDTGVIDTGGDDGRWSVRDHALDSDAVPTTLTGVLQARLDRLAPASRRTLQMASVVGRIFWDEATEALADDPATVDLDEARHRELVYRRVPSAFEGCDEYAFNHALLRDAAYESVLLRDRELLHAKAADWLVERAGDRVEEYLAVIAEHHERAGRAEQAAAYYHRVARAALECRLATTARDALERVFDQCERAGVEPPDMARVDLARAHLMVGDLDAAERAIAGVLDGPLEGIEGATILQACSIVRRESPDPADERQLLDRALALLDGEAVTPVHVEILIGRALWEQRYGDLDRSIVWAEQALAAAEQIGEAKVRIEALGVLGRVEDVRGDDEAAIGYLRAAFELAKSSRDPGQRAKWCLNLGAGLHVRGDHTADPEHRVRDHREALERYRDALDAYRALGDRLTAPLALINIAQVQLRLADHAAARQALREGLSAAIEVGSRRLIAYALTIEADRLVDRGEKVTALSLLGAALAEAGLDREARREIELVRDRIDLDASIIERELAHGRERDLVDVARSLVADGDNPMRVSAGLPPRR